MSRVHTLSNRATATVFSATLPPVLEVNPEEVIDFETSDAAYLRLWRGEDADDIADEEYNTVTGPVLVRGAAPGDALRIDLLAITILRAWAIWPSDFGPLAEHTDRLRIRPLPLTEAGIRLSDRLVVPLEPMVGCIGLAPTRGTYSTFAPAFPWGGNMDLREFSPGATLFLPVQRPGAMVSLGDVHAAMGQGEPTWISLESAARVRVRVGIEKGLLLQGPRLRLANGTFEVVIGDEDDSLEELQEVAIRRAYDLLRTVWGLDPFEAYTWCCARVGVRPGGPASPMLLAVVPDPW